MHDKYDILTRYAGESDGVPYGARTRAFLWLAEHLYGIAERIESAASWLRWKA